MSRNGEHTDCHIPHPAELLYCARPPPPPPPPLSRTQQHFFHL